MARRALAVGGWLLTGVAFAMDGKQVYSLNTPFIVLVNEWILP
jgi:hypothetical protein